VSTNGTWNGIMALVSSGIAEIGVGHFTMSKERTEVVTFTKTLGFVR
jgi:hypothetical protein